MHNDLVQLRSALQKRRPQPLPGEWLMQRAAVAAILRSDAGGPQLLLIRRARRRGDPWSGDMAFPGGLVGRGHADTRAGVLRETREETLWVPLAHFAEPRHREKLERRVLGVPLRFDSCRYDGRVVWGLTLRMIGLLTAN